MPALEVTGVVKDYRGLRPLRIADLAVEVGERVAISGLDRQAAEVFVDLVNGALLPDSGVIRVLGRSTADITEGDDWLSWLDVFGILTQRAVLLESSTLAQNLALRELGCNLLLGQCPARSTEAESRLVDRTQRAAFHASFSDRSRTVALQGESRPSRRNVAILLRRRRCQVGGRKKCT